MTDRFERIYAEAGDDLASVPWARLRPSPGIVAWLETFSAEPSRALVVGCGYGDDAEHLASAGWAVTAIDIAPTAIARCRQRFPGTAVDYQVADWFALPEAWQRAFALVVENGNVQALPDQRRESYAAIAETVTEGGTLFVRCFADHDETVEGPPWPITSDELEGIADAGLTVDSVEVGTPSRWWEVVATRA